MKTDGTRVSALVLLAAVALVVTAAFRLALAAGSRSSARAALAASEHEAPRVSEGASDLATAWTTDTIVVHAVIRSNLYNALDVGAASQLPKATRTTLAWLLADIYEYRIDMSRELRDGDAVRVEVERLNGPGGDVKVGNILAAGIERRGTEIQAIRFAPRGSSRAEYYDEAGRSLRAAFLRAPLSFRRISSVFGMRKHPILGEWRAHKGTDYAAASGTPVRSIGDGVVVFAGTRSGYGNSIDVRHPNGFVTRYGHLRGFAEGTRAGARVTMGRTIGFVGMTGLATAPHLHFEVIVRGVQRDPASALAGEVGVPLPRRDVAMFEKVRRRVSALLEQAEGPVRAGLGSP